MSAARVVHRFLTQPDGARALMWRAAWHLAIARVLLAIRGVAEVRDILGPPGTARESDGRRAVEIAQALVTVARHLPLELTCLDRAIALHRMLHESGIEATVRIGVARHTSTVDVERPLVAHAWVEHCGRVLLDDDVSGFSAFDPSTPPQQNESERT